MFFHKHPYAPFIHDDTEKLIVGTLPPPRFSTGDLLEKDVDFCYGSYYNSLWLFLDEIYDLKLRYDNSQEAIDQRKDFLIQHKIGVCDIVDSCKREKIDASDLGMQNIQLRDVIGYLQKFPNIHTLLFTGGNSKNGPEYFFRKHIKQYKLQLEVVSNEVPRIHKFDLSLAQKRRHAEQESSSKHSLSHRVQSRWIKTVSLTSSSGAANRAIGSISLYKKLKKQNPKFTTFDFRVMQYKEFF
ncbi:G/U mismatch-specific uracil-DNA glycosylase [Kordia periserrulae]|uniref:G/U mismatch-specific uracil-DNA glycosylase n=1 Tax=Kordia periserrulae TaxID=701523 RepID=A0A2T6C552_9FLAO|nr:uracil-DNA glycosylase family protein [Kordia periserrulae]PTX63449.1 G/U mismatch-specific uracil-DNA glycosylase [Kordia periserrulae]